MSRARELSKLGNLNVLSADDVSNEVGIASTVPRSTLDVRGELQVGTGIQVGPAGVITATSFDGGLSGNIVATACTFTTGTFNGNVTIGGTLTYEDVTNVDALGIVTARAGVNISGGQLQVGVAYSVGAAGVATAAGFVGGTISGTTGDFSSNLTVGSGITMGSAGVATFSGTSDIHLKDNVQLNVGDGSDLRIYHNGSHSFIDDQGTGNLIVRSDELRLRNTANDEIYLKADNGSSVDIYYNNSKKFETTNDGVNVTGIVTATSKVQINTPTIRENDNIPLLVKSIKKAVPAIAVQGENANGWTVLSDAYVDGESQFSLGLHYSGSGVFLGQKVGVNTTTDNEYVSIQDDHAFRPAGIVIDNGEIKIRNDHVSGVRPVGAAVTMYDRVLFDSTGDIDIYGTAAGITSAKWDASANAFYFKDNSKAYFGDSSDFSIYHDSSNSQIHNTTGTLRIRGDSVKINNAGASKNAIVCESDVVTLYYDNSAKLATTNEGIEVTGFTSTTAGMGVTGGLFEGAFIKAGKLSDNKTLGISTANVFYFTTQETTTGTPDIRWNDSYTLSSKMAVGEVASVTVITTAAAGGYSANWTIDGNAVTEEWVGGSAPSAGGSDGLDIYSLTIIKTGTGTGDSGWKVIGNLSNAT